MLFIEHELNTTVSWSKVLYKKNKFEFRKKTCIKYKRNTDMNMHHLNNEQIGKNIKITEAFKSAWKQNLQCLFYLIFY